MEKWQYVIIGAGPAGLTAADTIRRNDSVGPILVVGAESHRPYSRVMLPDFFSGEKPIDKLYLHPKDFYVGRGIDTKFGSAVSGINAGEHQIKLNSGEVIGYDKLLIATGSEATRLNVPGGDLPRVFYFHNLDDALDLKPLVLKGDSALVYGGGLVALEMTVAFKEIGANVGVVMRGSGFFWRSISEYGSKMIAERIKESGVPVTLGKTLSSIESKGETYEVCFSDKTGMEVKTLVVGIGTSPKLDFLKDSGISVKRGVLVDSHLRSNVTDVYAAGDAADFPDPFSGRTRISGNWQNAVFQGQTAGINMAGGDKEFAIMTGNAVDCFGLPIAFIGDTGDSESESVERVYEGTAGLRLFIKGHRLVGASCVGRFFDRSSVTQLIQRRDILSDGQLSRLTDPDVPLAELLS